MPQGHQAGDALQQVQAHGKDGQDHHARDHLGVEVLTRQRKGQQSNQAQAQQNLYAAGQGFQVALWCTHCLNKPSGL